MRRISAAEGVDRIKRRGPDSQIPGLGTGAALEPATGCAARARTVARTPGNGRMSRSGLSIFREYGPE